jgi:hypothetical protein
MDHPATIAQRKSPVPGVHDGKAPPMAMYGHAAGVDPATGEYHYVQVHFFGEKCV